MSGNEWNVINDGIGFFSALKKEKPLLEYQVQDI
jgi:hypothetical protein